VNGWLLDTKVVVWLLLGDRSRITSAAVAVLEDPRNPVAVSAVSVWEIAIKRSLGKLTIDDGWPRVLARLGFEPMPITALHAEAVGDLPWHHRDPFDRLLVAQASVERRTFVTADPAISAYDIDLLW
jgi:PIN domain nuclease of toxin-antitoxin system